MRKNKQKLTPMMKHYSDTKDSYPDYILFYRMGDFYEMFWDDAELVSKVLNLTLTARSGIPMAGVPHHAKANYLRKLIKLGYSVAICEQIEDPKTAKGIVKREVVEIITPGVQSDYENLIPDKNNYLLVFHKERGDYIIAYIDLSTYDFFFTTTKNSSEAIQEISKIDPSEILFDLKYLPEQPIVDRFKKVYRVVERDYEIDILDSFQYKVSKMEKNIVNSGFSYLSELKKLTSFQLPKLKRYNINRYMNLSETTISNLELFKTAIDKKTKGSLFSVLNKTITSMGARKLRYILSHPLRDRVRIERRVETVDYLIRNYEIRDSLKEQLKGVKDIERLMGRILNKTIQPRDILALAETLKYLKNIAKIFIDDKQPELINDLLKKYSDLSKLIDLIEEMIIDEPPATTKDGNMIKRGVDDTLDQYFDISTNSKKYLMDIEVREKQKTKITTLKIKYNKVFGYFIEVSKAQVKNVPKDYEAKQTLTNATRFITPELKELEVKLLTAEDNRVTLEQKIYSELQDKIASFYLEIKQNSEILSYFDLLYSLSIIAIENKFCKPQFVDGDNYIKIEEGRHPVLEQNLELETFIPNSLKIDQKSRFMIITGPNMAGKSTVMRQTALMVLLAQIGSYVPATTYKATIFDSIFTRVGASDNLTQGESTFMVEMKETAEILTMATKNSLLIMDELGRGTSTFDGISLAWAIAEYIHDKLKALTLFATHYHELTSMESRKEGVVNYSIGVKEIKGDIYFLRKIVKGAANRSYGINVAKLAGLPKTIVQKANKVLERLEKTELEKTIIKNQSKGLPFSDKKVQKKDISEEMDVKIEEKVEKNDKLRDMLKNFDINNSTPMEALMFLNSLKKEI